VRFVVDAQLPPRLARRLVELGHEAQHVADLDLLSASDRRIWNQAADTGAVLITKDADFGVLRALHSGGPAVVWVRLGNTTSRVLIDRIEAALPHLLAALNRGEQVVVVTES
jgi:predicted nuclease of predicted toxin-antitoxin system